MNLIPSNSALYESPATPWETSGDARDARNTQLRANPREDPIAAILKVLRQGKRFLVCSHSWPDGDAVGSMIAIGMLLEQMGKHVDLVTADRIPANCRSLPGVEAIRSQVRVKGTYDAAILLECDGLARAKLPGLEDFFLIRSEPTAAPCPEWKPSAPRCASKGPMTRRSCSNATAWPAPSCPAWKISSSSISITTSAAAPLPT